MGKIDIAQHNYLSNPRRFADIWNGIAFNGKQVINWKDLSDIDSTQTYFKNTIALKKTADLIKKWTSTGQELAILITENQDIIDYSLPVRVMFEEALSYHAQAMDITRKNRDRFKKKHSENQAFQEEKTISAGEYLYMFHEDDKLKPVAALVLYWGTEHWNGSTTLHGMIDFSAIKPEDRDLLKQFIPDYTIKVIDMNNISDDTNPFQDPGLRSLVGLLNKRNDKDALINFTSQNSGKMDSETQDLAVLMLGSDKLKKYYDKITKEGASDDKMCKAIDDLIKDSEYKGRLEGKIEGKLEGKIEGKIEGKSEGEIQTYVRIINDGVYTIEQAASNTNLSVKDFIAKAESFGFTIKNKPVSYEQ